MIVLTDVEKRFGSKKVLHKISFAVKKGEVVGFLGPNGAGKTTTMRLIMGYLKPQSGSLSVNGSDPVEERLSVLSSAGYLPENNPLYPEMKVSEYLTFVARVKNASAKDIKTVAKETSITDVLDQKIEHLSRGYKQRVGLAAALLSNPKILILDEPTSGLDPVEQEKIRELITKRKSHSTILLSTHILSEVEEVASRLIIIDKGRIVYDKATPKGKGAVEKLFKKLVSK